MIAVARDPREEQAGGLEVALDRPLPGTLPLGQASALFCVGTCFHPRSAVRRLAIVIDGERHRPAAAAMPRPDRFQALHPGLDPGQWRAARRDPGSSADPGLRSYRSGFWATVPIGPRDRPGEIELGIEAELEDGSRVASALGRVAVVAREGAQPVAAVAPGGKPLIAVCMATFDPDIELFRTQVESLRAQTDTDWICMISDDRSASDRFEAITEVIGGDERFVLSRAPEHLGFYRNFERLLGMAPAEAELIALCDHDDRWYPEKLAVLRAALGDAQLAYSDARLVDADGRERAETLWRGRRKNHTNMASLVISNTIVGASCLLRREVVERALPFPDGPGWDFHDHWLALVALAIGEIAYVNRPLYDYVQHPRAVLGRVASKPEGQPRASRFREWLERRRDPMARWRAAYFAAYLQRDLHARVLLARCASELPRGKRRALELITGAARSPLAFSWLAVRPMRALLGRNETLGAERTLTGGILWRHLIALRAGRRPGRPSDDAAIPKFDPQALGSRRRRWLANR